MGLYLYCVVGADAPAPAVPGIADAEVRAVRSAGVAVWVSELAAAPAPDVDALRRHNAVAASALRAGHTPVPIRFGQYLADEAALLAHLDDHDYRGALRRVIDAVEFGVRVVDPGDGDAPDPAAAPNAPDVPGSGPGAAWMRELARRVHASEASHERALDVAREIDRALADWVIERSIGPADHPPGAAVAHLVQLGSAEEYASRAGELAESFAPLRVVVTGPWPPYSFVS